MARKNSAQKAEAAARKALENPEAVANEGGDIDEPPAKKSKKQQHRKDKRKTQFSNAARRGVRAWPAVLPLRASCPARPRWQPPLGSRTFRG